MKTKDSTVLAVAILALVIFLVWGFWNRSNFTYNTPSGFSIKTYPTPSQELPEYPKLPQGATFNNSQYQTFPPSIDLQEQYYQCIAKECKGDTFDYPCLQRCRLKTYRRDLTTPNVDDWVCYYHRHNEDKYYKCLANVLADWKYP